MKLKRGVSLVGLVPQMAVALIVARSEYLKFNTDLIITSGNDGKHRKNSDHYLGRAVDLRTRNIPADYRQAKYVLAERIGHYLGKEFVCLFEGAGTPNEHIHLAWRP